MKSGAIKFLTAPLHEQELLDAIQVGILRNRLQRQEMVSAPVITGRRYEQIAARLEASEPTVHVNRRQTTPKMRAKSLVDLVRSADKPGISDGRS